MEDDVFAEVLRESVMRPLRDPSNRQEVLRFLALHGNALEYLPQWQHDREMVCVAMANHPGAIAFAPETWRADLDFAYEAVAINPFVFPYLADFIKKRIDIVQDALIRQPYTVHYMPDAVLDNPWHMAKPVRHHPRLLKHVSARLQDGVCKESIILQFLAGQVSLTLTPEQQAMLDADDCYALMSSLLDSLMS